MTILRFHSKREWKALTADPWEVCPRCKGTGEGPRLTLPDYEIPYPICPICEGHGSARKLALDLLEEGHKHNLCECPMDIPHVLRCADCWHPMSEGTWEGDHPRTDLMPGLAMSFLREGKEPDEFREVGPISVHYSPCDEGCRHGGPARILDGGSSYLTTEGDCGEVAREDPVEASWRQVDIRRLSWGHDLRPEQLAVLCLRCFADRQKELDV